jgi:hypothetical protein
MCGGLWKPRDKLVAMLGEQEAMVVGVKPFGLHAVPYNDVTVEFPDRTVEQARLGPESVPDGPPTGGAGPGHPGGQHGHLAPTALARRLALG